MGSGSFKILSSLFCLAWFAVGQDTPLVAQTNFFDDFEDGNANDWLITGRWEVKSDAGSIRYFLNTSDYESPDGMNMGETSWIANHQWTDFIFECLAKSADAAAGNNPGADLCIAFSGSSFARYYVNFNKSSGATQLHRLQSGGLTTLATYHAPTFNDGNYHALKITRNGSEIRAYFDGVNILSATDNALGAGLIGVGSFNDSGYFDDVRVTSIVTPAAPFTEVTTNLPPVISGQVLWGDYDHDDDLDVFITGESAVAGGLIAKLYKNTNGSFTEVTMQPFIPVRSGSAAWGDYDNDGDLDLLHTGFNNSSPVFYYNARIYRNDSGNFTDTQTPLVGVERSSVAWGDYDNDGDLDIILTGSANSAFTTKIYRNDAHNFVEVNTALEQVQQSAVAWGDYDNDGDLDLLLSGLGPVGSQGYLAQIYRNTNSNFDDIAAGLTGINAGAVAWGDYDSDGDLDILLTGLSHATPNPIISKIYRNQSNVFQELGANLSPASDVCVWGDYDNDGDLDVLLSGWNGSGANVTSIYRNDNGSFNDLLANLAPLRISSARWGDYDNDGDLDILSTGFTGTASVIKLYRNNSNTVNTLPSPPDNLQATVSGNSVALSWNKASDNQTPQAALTYNIRVGTTPVGSQIVSPMADGNTGYRRIVEMGNTNLNPRWEINHLKPGKYYWSVQAIDNAFAGSAFATEQSFEIIPPPCYGQALFVTAAGVTEHSVPLAGRSGSSIQVDIRLKENAQPIDAFGFTLQVDPAQLAFEGASAGDLTQGFLTLNAQENPVGSGNIICGGFGNTAIPASSAGVLLRLTFKVKCATGDSSALVLRDPVDDATALSLCPNVFQCLPCTHDGDVNIDGTLTPGDALCAFQIYLNNGVTPASCDAPNTDCEATTSDANCDDRTTPGDALAIFSRYLQGLPPLECFAKAPLAKAQLTPRLSWQLRTAVTSSSEPELVYASLSAAQANDLSAFGLVLDYPSDKLQFLGVRRGNLTAQWHVLEGNENLPGQITLGGFHHAATRAATGEVFELIFSKKGKSVAPEELRVQSMTDDFQNAFVQSRNEIAGVPAAFNLYQNSPNPFHAAGNANMLIRFDLPGTEATRVELSIYNLAGPLVRQLLHAERAPGAYEVRWDGRDANNQLVPSGTYLYRLQAGKEVLSKSMTIVR